jgi:hypothetical protein
LKPEAQAKEISGVDSLARFEVAHFSPRQGHDSKAQGEALGIRW